MLQRFLPAKQRSRDARGWGMKRGKWRWKKTRVIIEAAIIGTTAALLIILFAESRFDRQSHTGVAMEQAVAL